MANSLTAQVTDAAGNTGVSPAVLYTLSTTAPTVTSIAASGSGIVNGSGDLNAGHVVTLTVNFSAAVTVDSSAGSPTLLLNDGASASYLSGSGSSALLFSYTVAPGQNTADLIVSALNLNGATITGGNGLAANLTGATNYNPAGVLQIDADPNGQLSFVTKKATATAGPVTLKMTNQSGTPHNLAIKGNGVNAATPITPKGTVQAKTTLKPGTYTFYCQVPGHEQAGMKGTLTVK